MVGICVIKCPMLQPGVWEWILSDAVLRSGRCVLLCLPNSWLGGCFSRPLLVPQVWCGLLPDECRGRAVLLQFFADIELAVSREIDRVKWTIRFNFLFPILFHGC